MKKKWEKKWNQKEDQTKKLRKTEKKEGIERGEKKRFISFEVAYMTKRNCPYLDERRKYVGFPALGYSLYSFFLTISRQVYKDGDLNIS